MRILCLHGSGSSAAIFESQTAALRAMLPEHWEWIFINAELECGALPQLVGLYPGPHYLAVTIPTVKNIQAHYEWFLDIVEQEGPFDGYMGFSAGSYHITSMMLKLQKEDPCAPLPFRFAILMGGALPYSGMYDEGIEVTDWISFHREPCADLEKIKAFNEWAQANQDKRPHPQDPVGIHPVLLPLMKSHGIHEYSRDLYLTRSLHPEVCKLRLNLPTTHVYGEADPVFEAAKKMADLCDPARREICVHPGGHEVPRGKNDLLRLKKMIEKTVMRSQNNW